MGLKIENFTDDDIREALRGKHLVHEFGGRWNITK
jgi:hypothetical protein